MKLTCMKCGLTIIVEQYVGDDEVIQCPSCSSYELAKVCYCPCHDKGEEVMHKKGCCKFTYQKYLNKGVVDLKKYKQLLNMQETRDKYKGKRRFEDKKG